MKPILFLILIFCISCQVEENHLGINPAESISTESLLYNRISRSVQNQLVFDDFIDQNSATRIEFPFQVHVGSHFFSMTSTSDYQNLINYLKSTPENDVIDIEFPVDVSLIDYSLMTVNSSDELNALISTEKESSEINCVEINYPIQLNTTDIENSFISTETISSDEEFINWLISNSSSSHVFSLNYPLLIEVDGAPINITSNAQFTDAFSNLDNSCFNPVLYEYDPSENVDINDFIAFITSGTFELSSLKENNVPVDYPSYHYVFNADGYITTMENSGITIGDWEVNLVNNQLFLNLYFYESDLFILDKSWLVTDFSNGINLNLQHIDESNDVESILVFSKL